MPKTSQNTKVLSHVKKQWYHKTLQKNPRKNLEKWTKMNHFLGCSQNQWGLAVKFTLFESIWRNSFERQKNCSRFLRNLSQFFFSRLTNFCRNPLKKSELFGQNRFFFFEFLHSQTQTPTLTPSLTPTTTPT